jgi:spore coat polysaccharide biosynthesis protein SpsF
LRIAAFIVARQESTRLPGKALANANGKPVIQRLIEQVRLSKQIEEVWLLTSTRHADEPLATLAHELGCLVYRGDPEDVLSRLGGAAAKTTCDYILEIGGDCPFVDSSLIESGLSQIGAGNYDLVSNALLAPFTSPVGYDFILVARTAIITASEQATTTVERRQPFEYILRNSTAFRTKHFHGDENFSHLRWTLDYPEDLLFVQAIYERLDSASLDCTFNNVLNICTADPKLLQLNSMHCESVTSKSLWYTGSFVLETKADLLNVLDSAIAADLDGEWSVALAGYRKATSIIFELTNRVANRLETI